ncbi:MAG: PspA/IM30 family protein [Candidatus Electryoneaceae bacterium]|nr:PspA/IM30 family protein [Candidatus Electryoneaceae bacterium]
MAGLFRTLKNLVRGKSQEMADSIADPIRDGRLAIKDSEKLIANFTSKIAKLVAQNKALQRELTEATAEVNKYQGFAEKAATSNNIDDARQSLELKAGAQKRVETLTGEIERNGQLIKNLRDQLSKARAKVASAKRSITNLEARHEGAKIRTELAKASSEFNSGDNPLASLDALENAVVERESEAEAWEELNQDGAPADESLEEKYGSSTGTDVDAELAQLMAGVKKDS